ncbi:TolC family protein [Methylophilus luteus]|uniref:TolC family protein n=1 Tax=Methylophilus luteus TaxID=640108 RepID=A0ABW3F882_9PROT
MRHQLKNACMVAVTASLLTACNLSPFSKAEPPALVQNTFQFTTLGDKTTAEKEVVTYCAADPLLDFAPYTENAELNRLLAAGRENNVDLRIATQRVSESQAKQDGTLAALFPTLGLGLSAIRSDNSQSRADLSVLSPRLNNILGSTSPIQTRYRSQLGITGYEIDVWGRLRSLNNAEKSQVLSQQAYRLFTMVELQAQILTHYYDLQFTAKARSALQREMALRKKAEAYMQMLMAGGQLSELEIQNWNMQGRSLQKNYTDLERQMHASYGTLYRLTDLPELLQQRGLTALNQWPSQEMWRNRPIDSRVVLLRPDVQYAELNISRADGNIGAARAAFMPVLKLDMTFGRTSETFSDVMSYAGKGWTIMPSLFTSIFDFGKNRANLNAAKAQARIALIEYQKSLIQAYQDLQDAIDKMSVASTLRAQAQANEKLMRAIQLKAQAGRKAGMNSDLDILLLKIEATEIELDRIKIERDATQAQVLLYRALGGRYLKQCDSKTS